jgi:hypothetical protein
MPQHAPHCPFLNRADERCSQHFSLDRLDHAFRYCFDGYHACPVYAQLLTERRERRAAGDAAGELGDANHAPQTSRFVQVTLAARNAQSRAAAARALDASGV